MAADDEETERIRRLVDTLGESSYADGELTRFGRRALEPLLDALPRLGWSGKTDAIQLLEEIGDLGLTNEQEDQLVAFLKTLTDGYTAHKKINGSEPCCSMVLRKVRMRACCHARAGRNRKS